MKKILLTLFVGFVGFIGFSFGENVSSLLDTYTVNPVSFSSNWKSILTLDSSLKYKTICVRFIGNSVDIKYGFNPTPNVQPGSYFYVWWDWVQDQKYTCSYSAGDSYLNVSTSSSSFNGYVEYFVLDSLLATPLPMLTSEQCQSEYNLIPISSVDQNYCLNNNLCPGTTFYLNNNLQLGFPAGYTYYINYTDNVLFDYEDLNNEVNFNFDSSGSGYSGNWSALYINDIQHESSSNINITIPEEIGWDYNRTDENFDLTVSGYNVDTDYIAGIITTQNSKPSQEDLNKLVSEVLPLFIPGLAIILLIYFIFRFIKKVF